MEGQVFHLSDYIDRDTRTGIGIGTGTKTGTEGLGLGQMVKERIEAGA